MSWPSITLGDAVTFKGGGTPRRDNSEYWDGPIPWATVKDFNSGSMLRSTQESITAHGLRSSASNLIPAGTIIIPTRMALGKAVIAEIDVAINQDLKAVFPTADIEPRYLLWYFIENKSQIEAMGKGATVKGITLDQLRKLQIPLPSLPEQRRIAAILDKADALRAQRRESIAKLDQLLQSVFLHMFGDPSENPKGWPIGRVDDLLESVKYGSSEKAASEGEVPILRMMNLTYAGEMDLTDLKYIDAKNAQEKYLVRPGDILFNRTNSKELVGKTAVYVGPTPMAYAGYLVRGRTLPEHAPEYICGFMNSAYGKATLRGMCKSIVGMANINAREFSAIAIPIPPAELQATYQQQVSEIRLRRDVLERQSKVVDRLFSALQHRAFSGSL